MRSVSLQMCMPIYNSLMSKRVVPILFFFQSHIIHGLEYVQCKYIRIVYDNVMNVLRRLM